ncbi:MAG: GyrI-like domain-containing protein [Candidatus Ranarchaeia archaeon]|jgi:effector-binding domain-containing protein
MSEQIRLERKNSIPTVYFHALSRTPEEDAWKKAEVWAKKKGLLEKDPMIRIFGRNTYPTEKPEPHGYGYFLAIPPDIEIEPEMTIRKVPEGFYAVLRCEGIEKIGVKWAELWKWVNESKYEHIGETKGEYGFELGFEEHLNWYPVMVEKSESKFIFDLILQLKE